MGYTRVAPGQCVLEAPPPEQPINQCTNPTTPHPVVLATGSKAHSAVDFVSEDGLFRIGRTYRSFAGRATTSYRSRPLGLALGWRFDFGMELQLGEFSGSPSSPTGNVSLFAPDGSTYDFVLNSSGAFEPRAASGIVSRDYTVEFIGTLPTDLSTIYDSQTQWRITGPDDRRWSLVTFANINWPDWYPVARPTEIETRNGYTWTLSYGSDARLNTIEDSFGRTATFTWNMFYVTFLTGIAGSMPFPEAVDTITFPDGTSVKYLYDPAPATSAPSTSEIVNLVGMERYDSLAAKFDSTTYHYEDTDYPFALTGITDNRNVRVATYEYDTLGRVVRTVGADDSDEYLIAYGTSGSQLTRTVTNPLGKQAIYKFDKVLGSSAHIRLAGTEGLPSTHCPASASSLTYDANDFVATATDEEGQVTAYTRDIRGRPTEIVEADGTAQERTSTITWHSTFNVPQEIVTPDLEIGYSWGLTGRLDSVTQTDTTSHSTPYPTNGQTRTWAYTYTTEGLVSTVDGPLPGSGDTVSYTYSADGYVDTYTDEVGHTTTVNARNGRGQPIEIEDPNGLITEFTYDPRGFVISTAADPSGVNAVTVLEYDDAGNVTKVTQPNGAFLEMVYDDANRVVSVESNYGDIAEYSYDDMGNVTQVEMSNGYAQLFFRWDQTFDELGRLIALTSVAAETWTFGYDKVGNLTSSADPNGMSVGYGYDGLNRLVSFTDERSAETVWGYGTQDEPASTTDPRSVVTSYVRNGWGEVIQEQSNDIGTVVYERDQGGNVTERTDARNVVTEYAYDDASRLLSVSYPGEPGSDVAYTYDSVSGGNYGLGRLTSVTDAAGTVGYAYDILGRVMSEERVIGAQTYTTGYGYDDASKVTSITYPSGRIVYFDRDANGETEVVRHQPLGSPPSWLTFWIGRTPFGPIHGITFANGMEEWRSYDLEARATAIEILKSSPSTAYVDRTYVWGDKRNLTAITDNLDAANNETYTYAPNGFLRTARGPWSGTAATKVYSLASGTNRLAGVATGGTPTRAFVSDAAGNVIEDTDLSTSTTKELAYNHPGQLASVAVGGTPQGAYTYDYLTRLVVRQLPASTTTLHLIHDTDGNVIAEYDDTGTLLREYVWVDDRPIAAITAGSPSVTYWVHTDHLQRPVMMTDDSANVVWRAKYLPYGEVDSITGSATLDYRFPGQWFQLESGLAYNWHRHYDATTGRYVQPDPLGMPDGPSRWAYAGNSPLMNMDKTGQQTVTWGHGDRHVANPAAARLEILQCLPPVLTIGGPFWGWTPSGLIYRAYPLAGGRLHIGTYYPR